MNAGVATPVTAALAIAVFSVDAAAFSQGSPVCEVLQLPVVEMSPVLAQPPPSGWRLETASAAYAVGERLTLRVRHPDPERRVRGLLLWAKRSAQTGSGEYLITDATRWQHVPSPADCGRWALTHRDASGKPQSQLQFDWIADDAPNTLFRGFLIEDCPQSDCRAWQALTTVLTLEATVFRSGFEADGTPALPPPDAESTTGSARSPARAVKPEL